MLPALVFSLRGSQCMRQWGSGGGELMLGGRERPDFNRPLNRPSSEVSAND